jgi:hypothetical protein
MTLGAGSQSSAGFLPFIAPLVESLFSKEIR